MAMAAALCIGLGVAYPVLYDLLPFESHYKPYTDGHVITQRTGNLVVIVGSPEADEDRREAPFAASRFKLFGELSQRALFDTNFLMNEINRNTTSQTYETAVGDVSSTKCHGEDT